MATGLTTTIARELKSKRLDIRDLLEIEGCSSVRCPLGVDAAFYEYSCGLKVSEGLVEQGVAVRDFRGRFQPTGLLRSLHQSMHDAGEKDWWIELTVDENGHWEALNGIN